MNNIVIIEDNEQMQSYISDYLSEQDFTVHIVDDYDNIVNNLKIIKPDLVLLDINLPKYDGFFFLKLIKKNFDIPVLIISARSDESEQIRGIEGGANDYITKPFSIGLLLAKINMHLSSNSSNSNNSNKSSVLSYKNIELNTNNFQVSNTDLNLNVELTKNEMLIVRCLLENKESFVSRSQLLELLWDTTSFIDDNTLTVNITRVRKKLSTIGFEDVVINKRGVGYGLQID